MGGKKGSKISGAAADIDPMPRVSNGVSSGFADDSSPYSERLTMELTVGDNPPPLGRPGPIPYPSQKYVMTLVPG